MLKNCCVSWFKYCTPLVHQHSFFFFLNCHSSHMYASVGVGWWWWCLGFVILKDSQQSEYRMIQGICFSISTVVSVPQMLALLTFSFQRSSQLPASCSWYLSFLAVHRLALILVCPWRLSRRSWWRRIIPRERTPRKRELVADSLWVRTLLMCISSSGAFSKYLWVPTLCHGLPSRLYWEHPGFSQHKPRSPANTRKIAWGYRPYPGTLVMC